MIKAVIFDLDGVLADTELFSGQASGKALKVHGIELTDEEGKRAFGRRDIDSYSGYIESRGLDLNPKDLVKEKDRIYSELIKGKLKPIPGVAKLLKFLKKRGIPFAVASSGTPEKIRATLSELGFAGFFDIIVSAEDITKGKPDPEIFLKAAEKIGVNPGSCLVVEDAQAGIEAAKSAGMKCLALKSPNTYGQDLSGADRIINSLKEVKEGL